MSAWIRKRSPGHYAVAYRIGGRLDRERHAGSFRSLKEARARLNFVRLEIASGRDPKTTLAGLARARRSVREVGEQWFDSRIELAPKSRNLYRYGLERLYPILGAEDVYGLTPERVQEVIGTLASDLAPKTVRLYVRVVLGQVLDYADVEPNPVRHRKVRFPRVERPIPRVPTRQTVQTVLSLLPARYELPVIVMEQTGMRVGEVCALEWQDVDERASRLHIRQGKTRSARRWAQTPEWVTIGVASLVPRDDRTATRRVFPGLTPSALDGALRRAAVAAGVPVFSCHDLRHRYASVQAKRGVPRTDLAAQLGHANISQLDTYEHVVIDEEELL